MQTIDDLKTYALRFADDIINARDLGGALDSLVAEDFVEQNPMPGQGPGRAGLAGVLAGMFAAFPDLRWTLLDTIAENDRVMTLSSWTGTHEGPFLGLAPTGRQVRVEAWTLDRYRDGKLVESRIIMDIAGLRAQLGQ
ncbi:ester cyclase [Paractinoplanes lichenicola]|uniref:Ester cyclase n=1 Tax=Paractinoplanes lichenicola TaxID=2802976 RepID=A0ABS1VYA7_9ACTN|nr:ester cyclase [Actinoplanes lichenicola]MBL7259434.1 ester cyclase [Actinoplanes lichenicola]